VLLRQMVQLMDAVDGLQRFADDAANAMRH